MAAVIGVMAVPGAAWANCTGNFTHVHSGSGSPEYSLTGSQSLRVKSGTFSGNIKRLDEDARICVDPGANFNPSSINNPDGTILNYGTSNLPSMNPRTGFTIDNFNRMVFTSNVNFNGSATITNRAGADLIFRQAVHIRSGSTVINDGRIIADGDLNLADDTLFRNNFDVLMKGPFNANGTFDNHGRLHTEAFININSSAKATNYCSWIADRGFNNNTNNTTRTFGLIFINWQGVGGDNLFQNNGAFMSGPDAITFGWRFINNNNVTGEGRYYFRKPATTSDDQHTKNQGRFTGSNASNPIVFYDDTPSSGRIFDQQNQNPTNTVRQYFDPPRIDLATPGCSAAIRQILYDPSPPAVTYDHGDAPGSYGAPVHRIVDGMHLGTAPPDWDGRPFDAANADGDDKAGEDDEDGVTLGTLQRGVAAALDVRVAGAGGYLQAWIDYDGDGSFGAGEQVAANRRDDGTNGDPTAGDGRIRITFTPPLGATSAQTYLRLRWSTVQGLNSTASAPDGEVEDYAFTFGLAPEPDDGAGAVASSCPVGTQLITRRTGAAAQSAIGSVVDAANAVGLPAAEGAYASASNAAHLSGRAVLLLDLTNDSNLILASGADIRVAIARDTTDGQVVVALSPNGTQWTEIGSWGLGGSRGNDFTDDVLDHILLEAPEGGARYVRFTGKTGAFWIDGVSYDDTCGPPAALTVAKSSAALQNGSLLLPGTEVAYTITVTNTGYGAVDPDTLFVVDSLPSTLDFYGGPATGEGANGPFVFTETGTELAFNAAFDAGYSNNAAKPTSFAQCTYAPAAGYDPAVRHICLRPTGAMVGGPNGTAFTVRFRARVK